MSRKAVVEDPEKRKLFRQFVNTDDHQGDIEFIDERGQKRPADWPRQSNTLYQIADSSPNGNGSDGNGVIENGGNGNTPSSRPRAQEANGAASANKPHGGGVRPVARSTKPQWVRVGETADFPVDGGAAVKYGEVQIAVFRAAGGEWYATQNMCPHKNAFVLSRGIVGDASGEPKVACPLHKTPFSLTTGQCLNDSDLSVKVFPVRVEGDAVYLQLPDKEQLNAILGSDRFRVRQSSGACAAYTG